MRQRNPIYHRDWVALQICFSVLTKGLALLFCSFILIFICSFSFSLRACLNHKSIAIDCKTLRVHFFYNIGVRAILKAVAHLQVSSAIKPLSLIRESTPWHWRKVLDVSSSNWTTGCFFIQLHPNELSVTNKTQFSYCEQSVFSVKYIWEDPWLRITSQRFLMPLCCLLQRFQNHLSWLDICRIHSFVDR